MTDTKIFMKNLLVSLVITFVLPLAAFSNETEHYSENTHAEEQHLEGDHKQSKEHSPTDAVMEHIADSYDWHIIDYDGKPISMPLPVILYSQHSGFHLFSSANFHHGHSEYMGFKIAHEGDYKNKVVETITNADGQVEEVLPLDFSITKNVASLFLSAILLLLIFISVARAYKKRGIAAPKGLQSFIEPIIVFVKDEVVIPNIGEKKYKKFLPYLLTVFFFIWINNIMGLIPFFPGGANLTGNIATTFVLAIGTLIATNLFGNKQYWGHIFAMPGVPAWLLPIFIIVELVGVIAKPFALMIRLFANILAGHIIVLSLISLIFIFKSLYIAPVSIAFVLFMDVLELFVAALQAYIFTMLSALFIGLAVQEHH
jgi:F-type H+-transporting ATPase subunit a